MITPTDDEPRYIKRELPWSEVCALGRAQEQDVYAFTVPTREEFEAGNDPVAIIFIEVK